jgi:DNA-binding CsgD family transcriptional regulator
MNHELVVSDAAGDSILRLPWFEDGLFVGRQLPDIAEMPRELRLQCVTNYRAALKGDPRAFTFTSYGHTFTVDAKPVCDESGNVESVLALARPAGAAANYERVAECFEQAAELAERRAERFRVAVRPADEAAQRQAAERAHAAALRARCNAQQLSAPNTGRPVLTARECEVLQLVSHGLTLGEIAGQLTVTPATVKTHLQNIYAKLGVGDRAGAVAHALRAGIID